VLQQLVPEGTNVEDILGESLLAAFQDDFVKTFERVPGATIEGSGAEPGQEVAATVEMRKPSGETFEYTQYAEADSNGEFECTVPYSTTGYDEFGPENGYTNTSVRATGAYTVSTEQVTDDDLYTTQRVGQVEVTEGQVVGVDESAAMVQLEERVIDCPSGDPECPVDGSGSDGGDGSGNESAAVAPASPLVADATTDDATPIEGASA
jgi:dolichyl-diphosphooligosaccharide--protein glycosyltransferase